MISTPCFFLSSFELGVYWFHWSFWRTDFWFHCFSPVPVLYFNAFSIFFFVWFNMLFFSQSWSQPFCFSNMLIQRQQFPSMAVQTQQVLICCVLIIIDLGLFIVWSCVVVCGDGYGFESCSLVGKSSKKELLFLLRWEGSPSVTLGSLKPASV